MNTLIAIALITHILLSWVVFGLVVFNFKKKTIMTTVQSILKTPPQVKTTVEPVKQYDEY